MNDNREIPTGLHAHARQTALFVANNATGLLFIGAATQYGVLYDDVRVGLLAYLAGGTLMGWEASRTLKDAAGLTRFR